MNNRQLGRFKVSEAWVQDNPDAAAKVMALLGAVVLRVTLRAEYDTLEYLALSEKFSEVPLGNVVPEYLIEISVDNGETVSVTVSRIPPEEERLREAIDRLRRALRYVLDNHHEGDGEFNDVVMEALR